MSNAVSSLVFAYRNVGKTERGEIGRAPVAVAQGMKVIDKVVLEAAKYNDKVAKGTEAATSIFKGLAKESKIIDGAAKVSKWAMRNVNPMICVSGGIKTLMSDDKITTGVTELGALGTMFAGEKTANILLKKAAEHEFKDHTLAKLFNKNSKLGAVVHGALFVCASIASYAVGERFGKDIAKSIKANTKIEVKRDKNKVSEDKKIDQKA